MPRHGLARLVEVGQHLLRPRLEFEPDLGRPDAARCAAEKLRPEFGLQPRDASADDRLRHAEAGGRAAETACSRDFHETSQIVQLRHGVSNSATIRFGFRLFRSALRTTSCLQDEFQIPAEGPSIMSTVLVLNSGIPGEGSVSRRLVGETVEALRRQDPTIKVINRDVGAGSGAASQPGLDTPRCVGGATATAEQIARACVFGRARQRVESRRHDRHRRADV